jgi:hypothetical protein
MSEQIHDYENGDGDAKEPSYSVTHVTNLSSVEVS